MSDSVEKVYICECGKEFDDPQKFNGHKAHCKAHLGEIKWLKNQQQVQNWAQSGVKSAKQISEKSKKRKQEKLEIWIAEKHTCEYCGKVMTELWGSGRFCSKSCAHGYAGKIANKHTPIKRIKKTYYCLNCGKIIENDHASKNKFCCHKCSTEYRKKLYYQKYKNDNSIAWGRQNMKYYKPYFLEEQNHRCAICGHLDEWEGKPLVFVLDHIDGNADNNARTNLRLICPNCDSQLDTFKSKNKHSARAKYRNIKIVKKE